MQDFLYGAAAVLLYLIPLAVGSFTARHFIKIPDELFRKILHFILLGAYIPLVFAFEVWWTASAYAVGLIALFYPAIAMLEKWPRFAAFVNQRKDGEIKNSMILALSMMAISTAVCWGLFGDRFLVLACIYAWGVGDAFAALIGKRFGRHKVRFKYADQNKRAEGSAAMLGTSAAAVFAVLLIRGGIGMGWCLVISLLAAAAAMIVELCTKEGYDTFTCPLAAMAVILPLLNLAGGC